MSSPLFDLTGRRALVTGSSQGIGLAIARGLADAGAEVILNGRNANKLDRVAAALAANGARVHQAAFDVTAPEQVTEHVGRIEREIGPIDILVNNAGMQHRTPLEDFPLETFRDLMRMNVESVFIVAQTVARHMIPRKRGRIINIASIGSEIARQTIAPYVASKGAVKQLTKGMCADWARHGLQVNAIAPGYFKTELNAALIEDRAFNNWLMQRTPCNRWGELPELAGAAVFLASDAASFVNGHLLIVDGGLSAVA